MIPPAHGVADQGREASTKVESESQVSEKDKKTSAISSFTIPLEIRRACKREKELVAN